MPPDDAPHVELTFTDDPAWFLEQAAPVLAADPVLSTIVGSVTRWIAADGEPPVTGVPRWWVLVHENGELVSAAMRTMPMPPYAPFLLPMSDAAAVVLASTLHDRGEHLAAANGVLPTTRVLAEETARLSGARTRIHEHHRLHRLGTLVAPRPTTGRLRAATLGPDDLALARRWFGVFHDEADRQAGREPEAAGEQLRAEVVDRRVEEGMVWFWEDDGRPVHLTAANPPAEGVARIGPVFTPGELRGRGYASAAVHEVSRMLRAEGAEVCLFTDQANPTSTKVYADLGFEAYADTAHFRIEPGPAVDSRS